MSGSIGTSQVSAKRIALIVLSLFVAFFLIMMAFFVLTTPDWRIENAPNAWTESPHDMVLDSQGNPCMAFLGDYRGYYTLIFGKRIADSWNMTPLKTLNWDFFDVSIALDSKGKVHISTGCDNATSHKGSYVTYATNENGSWVIKDIATEYIYAGSKIAVDSHDLVHILCSESERGILNGYVYTAHLMLLTETPNEWNVSKVFDPIENASTQIQSFDIAGGDSMHALIRNNFYKPGSPSNSEISQLQYCSTMSGNWTQETIQSDLRILSTGRASMIIDDNNKSHVCYYLWDNATSSYGIVYANNIGGSWAINRVGYGGNNWPTSCSLAIDTKNAIHIAYYAIYYNSNDGSLTNHTERYLTNQDGSWKATIIDNVRGWIASQRICIAIGSNDQVQISYLCNLRSAESGDRWFFRYATPYSMLETFENATVMASLYTLAAMPFVGIGILVYWRRKNRSSPSMEQEQGDNREF